MLTPLRITTLSDFVSVGLTLLFITSIGADWGAKLYSLGFASVAATIIAFPALVIANTP
jgi:hypothetical protein